MKYLLTFSIVALFFPAGKAQVLEDYIMKDAAEITGILDEKEEICLIDSKTSRWVNPDQMSPGRAMRDKFTIVHFADFGQVESAENIEVLTQIQKSFPTVRIFLVNASPGSYPATQADILKELNILNAPFPVLMDSAKAWTSCLQVGDAPTTLFISPKGKLMQNKRGRLYFEQLKGAMDNVLATLAESKPMDKIPFMGKVPGHLDKKPLLQYPSRIESNSNEGFIYLSDYVGNRIIGITPFGDMVVGAGTGEAGYKDGPLNSAQFDGPKGMAFDPINNALYVADSRNNRIRKIDFASEEVTTFLGSGRNGQPGQVKISGTGGAINRPTDLLIDGNKLYIAMGGTSEIWMCDLRTAVAERYAGTGIRGHKDGPRLDAQIGQPEGLALDISGALFFSDAASSCIRTIDNGIVSTVAGGNEAYFGNTDGKGDEILFDHPAGLTSVEGILYIADAHNHSLRKLEPYRERSETLAGKSKSGYVNGTGTSSRLNKPSDVVFLSGALYIADAGNGLIRKFDLESKKMSAIPLSNYGLLGQGYLPMNMDIRDGDTITVSPGYNEIRIKIDLGDAYELDFSAYSSVSLTAREDSIQMIAPGFDNGTVHIGFFAEDIAQQADFAIDFNLFFKSREQPERQYYRGLTFVYSVVKADKGATLHEVTTVYKPDLPDGEEPDDPGEME